MNVAYLMRRLCLLLAFGMVLSAVYEAEAQQVPRPNKKGRKYKVRIDSAPQQAAIYLDDEKYGIVGYTPWTGKLQKGSWKVIIKKDGYELATRTIDVKRTRRTQETFLPMVKQEQPAVLEVRADADRNAFNAEVWVNDQLQGKIPVTMKLTDGRHLVEIKKQGFENFKQWVTVKEGERISVNPMLRAIKKKEVGSILVNSDVPDAEIYLDGNLQNGKTPTLLPDIAAGPHVVEVRKEPALPWRQTVQVIANKTIKVTAGLKATIGGQGGNIRVLTNVEGASVYLDGDERGKAPIDLKGVKPGDHVVEVRAPGFITREERVTVAAGAATVLKLDLQSDGAKSVGIVKVVSPVPEALVYIDGEKIGGVPQEKELATGEHFVVVSKPGFKRFERKLVVEEGKVITVTAELKAVGGVRFLSNPGGAKVMMDGETIGVTPMVNEDIAAGEHIISVLLDGYFAFETSVKVEGGKMKVVNAVLEKIKTGPTVAQKEQEQRSLTSFGARALPKGRSTIDFASGYPYYLTGGITVGAGRVSDMAFDAGVNIRSYFARTDLALKGRLTISESNPFSFGVFGDIGGGGDLLGNSERNTWFADAGALVSLTGLGAVTVTGKSYLSMWSDRHCPGLKSDGTFDSDSDPTRTCEQYADGTIDSDKKGRIDKVLGGDGEIFNRETGVRLMIAIIVEVAIKQRWNVWAEFETGILQDERGAFLGDLYGPMFESDPRRYFKLGATFKF